MKTVLENPSANCFRKFKGLQLTFQVVHSNGYPPAVRPTSSDAARLLCDGRNRIQTGSGASCVRSWGAVSSVASRALSVHRLLPPLGAVQHSHCRDRNAARATVGREF